MSDTTPWYRGTVRDWILGTVLSVLIGIGGWVSYYLQAPDREPVSDIQTVLTMVPWHTAVESGGLLGLAGTPLVVLAIRWYDAGEPLPDRLQSGGYKGYLITGTACQVIVGLFALTYAALGYPTETLASVLNTLGTPIASGILITLIFLMLAGMIVPPIAMYLDARAVAGPDLLSVRGARLLHYVPIFGVQMAGIPTVIAVWYYLSKRKTAKINQQVMA